jgi:hypothetical protein
MNTRNCARADGDCWSCCMFDEEEQECNQDDDFGGTGHGDDSFSDADPGL